MATYLKLWKKIRGVYLGRGEGFPIVRIIVYSMRGSRSYRGALLWGRNHIGK